MIKFIENSETQLKFVSYPIISFASCLILLFILIPFIYWCLYLSPIYSSLTCQKGFLNRVDCQLLEKSILNSHLTQINISNIKKTGKHFFGSRDARIIIKANPNPPYFYINMFQKTYFYPNNPFSLVLFRNFNPFNWFNSSNQEKQLNNFIQRKSHQSVLILELKVKGVDYLFVGFPIGMFLLFICNLFYWFIAGSILYCYEIDLNKKIMKIVDKRIFLKDIRKEYKLNQIGQVKLDKTHKGNLNSRRIILELEPDYDYTIDEFFDIEQGEKSFQIIKSFIEKSKQ